MVFLRGNFAPKYFDMKLFWAGSLVIGSLIFTSCSKTVEQTPGYEYLGEQKTAVKQTYADMAFAVYTDSYTSAVTLQTKINDFVQNPSAQTLQDAKNAWLAAREVYGLSEVFRFVDGPIDNPADGPEGLINSWPMDEAFVDYVQGDPTSGIINNIADYPVIDESTIIGANEFGGETNISCGYHAIEFLLWGQDFNANGPGNRPYTDYIVGGGSASNEVRRGQYLTTCANLLVEALDQVRTAWDPNTPSSYYHTFLNMDNTTALRKMFNSMNVLAGDELAGERVFVAYQNEDQEDEHSCFSDNTHRDIYLNARGIYNLYLGQYASAYGNNVSGYSLKDLFGMVNPTKRDALTTRFETSQSLILDMYIPFDQAIILPAERPKVYAVVVSLRAEADQIVDIAGDFNIHF